MARFKREITDLGVVLAILTCAVAIGKFIRYIFT